MKQTTEQMIAALEAFECDNEVEESYNEGQTWSATSDPTWDFKRVMYRPVQKPIVTKYLCYEHMNGALCWFQKGGKDQLRCANKEDIYTRVPELDRQVVK